MPPTRQCGWERGTFSVLNPERVVAKILTGMTQAAA